jgi:hypothetical protein
MGAELKEALYALARWGARTIGPLGPDDELYAEWGMNACRHCSMLKPRAA